MHPIARQSARLASHSQSSSCSRIRHQSLTRAGCVQQARTLNSSTKRASEPRSPEEQNAWLERQREEERKSEQRKPQAANATENAEVKSNGEGRKLGGGRKRPGRVVTEIPKPPPIPEWFLRHNVALYRETTSTSAKKEETIRCVDTETGHTLFTLPYYGAWPDGYSPPESRHVISIRDKQLDVSALHLDGKELAALPEKAREEAVTKALIDERAKKPEEVDLEALRELLVSLPKSLQDNVLRLEKSSRKRGKDDRREGRTSAEEGDEHVKEPQLGRTLDLMAAPEGKAKNPGVSVEEKLDRVEMKFERVQRHLKAKLTKLAAGKPEFFSPKAYPWQGDGNSTSLTSASQRSSAGEGGLIQDAPLFWFFLEAETAVNAAFTLAQQGNNTALFAASRVDLSLLCPDSDAHEQMDELVAHLSTVNGADIIRLDANDFEDLTSDYVGGGKDEAGTFGTMGYEIFDGYEASSNASNHLKAFNNSTEDDWDAEEDEYDEDEEEDEDAPDRGSSDLRSGSRWEDVVLKPSDLMKSLQVIRGMGGNNMGGPKIIHAGPMQGAIMSRAFPRGSSASEYPDWDDVRLAALLDNVLDAAKQKRERLALKQDASQSREGGVQALFRKIVGEGEANVNHEVHRAQAAEVLSQLFPREPGTSKSAFRIEAHRGVRRTSTPPTPRTIIHVRDLKDIMRTRIGDAVVRRLAKVVQKRRRAGENIIIVGTTAQGTGDSIFMPSPHQPDEFPFRTITVPPLLNNTADVNRKFMAGLAPSEQKTLDGDGGYARILEINLRHIRSMLRRLQPGYEEDLMEQSAKERMAVTGTYILSSKVLSLDHVQRLVLTAIGLAKEHAVSDAVRPVHIALAIHITNYVDHLARAWRSQDHARKVGDAFGVDALGKAKDGANSGETDKKPTKVDEIRPKCNSHETRLLTGVVDAQNIKTGFADVHVPPETTEALKTLTSLSLLRPEAFQYGVLANDRLPGLLLYGPPGTGKTLLAKAVAKESSATVLEVSGAQIYEKYVGEGEKMVRAVFSLAKKLSPCVVFIDEADAIFGSRSNSGNRNTHREIINQFLREWDGLDDQGCFMMVASNRPFDLDDAVLRRLPRRLLVDLPVAKDREAILRIHLKGEELSSDVHLAKLSEQTPFYSGSDLKNLCVAAALAAVREENELAVQHKEDKEFKLPEKRTLTAKHFEKALQEISASVSEDMASLTAIRKFDEQFGDRKGRRKKTAYGFGGGADEVVDESSVRVRQVDTSISPPPA